MPAAKHRRAATFAFDEKRRTAVIVCAKVMAGARVLEVSHDDDGGWQFLCGDDHADEHGPDGAKVHCLECVVAADPSLNEVADLPCNWIATRSRTAWKRHDQIEDMIRDTVARHGWFVALIPPGDDGPAFAYTVGLTKSFKHPEIVCVGLPGDRALALIDAFGARLAAGGKRPPVGKPFTGVIKGLPTLLRPVRSRADFGYATWFAGGKKLDVLQLVWPDREGRLAASAMQPFWR